MEIPARGETMGLLSIMLAFYPIQKSTPPKTSIVIRVEIKLLEITTLQVARTELIKL